MRLFAKVAIGLCCLFVFTILLLIAAAFATRKSPVLVFLDHSGTSVIILEAVAILLALLGTFFEKDPADSAPSSSDQTAQQNQSTPASGAEVPGSEASGADHQTQD
jgi:hypothetical protein